MRMTGPIIYSGFRKIGDSASIEKVTLEALSHYSTGVAPSTKTVALLFITSTNPL